MKSCAVHYQDSSAVRYGYPFHQRLRQAEVHLSEDISSTIELVFNGIMIARRRTQGRLHFQDDGNHIRLYVPRDAKSRELSYLTDVPERIVSHFEIKELGAAKVFGDVLKCTLAVLDDVLKSHGIVRLTGSSAEHTVQNNMISIPIRSSNNILRSEFKTREDSSSVSLFGGFGSLFSHPESAKRAVSPSSSLSRESTGMFSRTESGTSAKSLAGSRFSGFRDIVSGGPDSETISNPLFDSQIGGFGDRVLPMSSSADASSGHAHSASSSRAASIGSVQSFPTEEVRQEGTDHTSESYRELLDHVIRNVQSDRGQVRQPDEAFMPNDAFGVRSSNPLLHDMKIGAAGELYVRMATRYLTTKLSLFCRLSNFC